MDGKSNWSGGIVEKWNNGSLRIKDSMFFSIKPIIPAFHYSNIPAYKE
jgi:hypothetical protein